MHGTAEIIEEAILLPVEERYKVVESLLQTLNPHNEAIDNLWRKESLCRLDAVRKGTMATIDGESVFADIHARYGK